MVNVEDGTTPRRLMMTDQLDGADSDRTDFRHLMEVVRQRTRIVHTLLIQQSLELQEQGLPIKTHTDMISDAVNCLEEAYSTAVFSVFEQKVELSKSVCVESPKTPPSEMDGTPDQNLKAFERDFGSFCGDMVRRMVLSGLCMHFLTFDFWLKYHIYRFLRWFWRI